MADHLFSFCAFFFFGGEVLGDEINVIDSFNLIFRNRQIIEKDGSNVALFTFEKAAFLLHKIIHK